MPNANLALGKVCLEQRYPFEAADMDGIDEYALQVILTILHIIGNLRNTSVEASSEVELSYPQSLLLYTVLEAGSATITQLSNSLKVTQGVVSRMVDRLEEKGLVERSRDREDRRVVTVRLSPQGREFALSMIDMHLEGLRKSLMEISPEDRERFLSVLKGIEAGMEREGGASDG